MSAIASFPGPAQLSDACSTYYKQQKAMESWAEPGNAAMSAASLIMHSYSTFMLTDAQDMAQHCPGDTAELHE